MSDPIDDAATYTADPYDPQALAREAVEAIRTVSTDHPHVESAILAVGQRQAAFLTRIGWPEGDADG